MVDFLHSTELFGERNDDALRSTDVAEPVPVLILFHTSNGFGTMSLQPGKDVLDVFDGEHYAAYA